MEIHPSGPPIQPSYLHHYVDLDQVRLHYVELGHGPLVILLHGFPESWYSWRYQIPALAAAGFRAVAPDMRGYNLSSKPAGITAYSSEHLSADIAGLIRSLGAERAMVVGHDWGAVVAWAVAMRFPEMVERLAILNVPHPIRFMQGLRTWQQLRKSWYIFFFQIPWLPEASARASKYALFREVFRSDPVRQDAYTEEDIDRTIEAIARPGALTAMINYYRAAFRVPRSPGRITRIDAPTLVIWGDQDNYLGKELAEPPAKLVPNARVEHLPDASHWVHADRLGHVNQLLIDFFSTERRSL